MNTRLRTTAPDRAPAAPSAPTPATRAVGAFPAVPAAVGPEAVADRLRGLAPAARAEAVRGLQRSRGNRWMEGMATGRPLPDVVRARMEGVFGVDFSDVSVREDDEATALDAAAFTRGSEIVFSRGIYDAQSPQGLAVLGHELAHVLQQRAGRVQGDGMTEDLALEAEADQAGERAARGEPVGATVAAPSAGLTADGAQVAQPLPNLKLPKFLRRFGRSAPAPAPQAAPEPPPYMTVQLTPEPTEKLEQLRSRFLALKSQFNRTHDPVAKAAVYAQVQAALEDIGDAYDEYEGNAGLGRRLKAAGAARSAEMASAEPAEGGGGEPRYQKTPGGIPSGPAENAYASPHLNQYASPHLPENPYASPHLPESPYGVWRPPRNPPPAASQPAESPYANIPMEIAESPYANIPPEILARGQTRQAESPYANIPMEIAESPYANIPPEILARGQTRQAESPYANIPMEIAESPYANIPPEILARGQTRKAAAPAAKPVARRKAQPPRKGVPTPFIPSYRRRG
jgi:hypothetical protein